MTVWDVALRDWPKAMMPATALRAHDTFSGRLLKHPLREGQPLLSIQLLPSGQASQPVQEASPSASPADYTRGTAPVVPAADADLWAPAAPIPAAEPIKVAVLPPAQTTVADPQPIVAQPVPTQAAEPQPAPPQPTVPETQPAPAESVAVQPAASETATADIGGDTVSTDPVVNPVLDTVLDPALDPVLASPGEEAVAATPPEVPSDATEPAVPNAPAVTQEPEPAPAAESTVTAEAAAAPVAAEPTAPATPPTATARPVHGRYLVVPESIALKADSSFVSRADAQPPEAEPVPRGPARDAAENVRPLPPTTPAATTTARGPQSASPRANAPQGRSPQRQGRQSPAMNVPENNGRPTGGQPSRQPRFGTTMFPNISAGMNAIEGRLRRDQPEQGEAATAAPVTAR
ncbi:MAG: hypothetical protein ACKOK8_11860 [Planctomycetia bacterium]